LAAISLATVPVTPMTFVKFNFKFANSSKSYEIHKTKLYGETRGNPRPARRPYDECFPEGVLPSRCTFVELHLHLCEVPDPPNISIFQSNVQALEACACARTRNYIIKSADVTIQR
jgi:hypothetical protein